MAELALICHNAPHAGLAKDLLDAALLPGGGESGMLMQKTSAVVMHLAQFAYEVHMRLCCELSAFEFFGTALIPDVVGGLPRPNGSAHWTSNQQIWLGFILISHGRYSMF